MKFIVRTFEKDAKIEYKLEDRHIVKIKILDSETLKPINEVFIYNCGNHTFSSLRESKSYREWVGKRIYHGGAGDIEYYIGPNEVVYLSLFAKGYEPVTTVLMITDPDATEYPAKKVLMKKAVPLSGMIVDAQTGMPITGAMVTCYMKGRMVKTPTYGKVAECSSKTGKDGVFTLSGLGSGRFFLKVEANEYAPAVIDTSSLDPLASVSKNIIRLYRSGMIFGRILTGDGQGIEGAMVKVRLPATNEVLLAHSTMDGKYVIGGLPPGKLAVSVSDMMDDRMSCSEQD